MSFISYHYISDIDPYQFIENLIPPVLCSFFAGFYHIASNKLQNFPIIVHFC